MRMFDSFNQTVNEDDKVAVKNCLLNEIEMAVDELGHVWTEDGFYIADAIDAPENGIGFELFVQNL